MDEKRGYDKNHTSQITAAVGELHFRVKAYLYGWIPTPTDPGLKGIDVIIYDEETRKSIPIQIKSKQPAILSLFS